MATIENKIEIYEGENGQLQVEVKFDKETVWLNRHHLALLFGRDIKTIGKHLNNVFKDGELVQEATAGILILRK